MNDRDVLARLCEAEREAAALMLQAHDVLAERKTDRRDVVTEYDRRVQELVIGRLSAALPKARFFCEENDRHDDLRAEEVFIIDPIDGTMNFVHGLHHSCISAAYMLSGELRAAAIFNPYVGELFTAVKGEGAFLNGRPLRVSDEALAESLVCCGTTPYDAALADRGFALMKAAFLAGLDIRREGSAALDLCSAAAGRCGVYFELGLSLWDYAAGKLLVEEAGGVCCTIDGAALPMDPTRPSVVAGGRRAVEEFLQLAREV
ncbi:MAG: inositol monophosphatase [Oscillospiraceae bacterium]|nr:inositol monophosphatase [Oscillospiraceae bacterium]